MKIAVDTPGERELKCVKSFLERREAFLAEDVEFVDHPDPSADLLITVKQDLESIKNSPIPVVVVDTADDAMIQAYAREAAGYPHVKAVLKMALATPKAQLMGPRRFHLNGPFDRKSYSYQNDRCVMENWDKFQPAPPWWSYRVVQPLFEQVDTLQYRHAHRPIDIHFRGTVDYGHDSKDARALSAHRREIVDLLEALQKKAPYLNIVIGEGRIPRPQYYEELRQSKVVISPWGWGETCIRTCEGLLSGCDVVVPETNYLVTGGTSLRQWFRINLMTISLPSKVWDLEPVISSLVHVDRSSLRQERVAALVQSNKNFVGWYSKAFKAWVTQGD